MKNRVAYSYKNVYSYKFCATLFSRTQNHSFNPVNPMMATFSCRFIFPHPPLLCVIPGFIFVHLSFSTQICAKIINTREILYKQRYYYYHVALQATEGLHESGGLNWQLTLCLLLSWIIIFAITCKGVESMGKVGFYCGNILKL